MNPIISKHIGQFELVYFTVVILDVAAVHSIPVLRLVTNPLIVATLIIYYKSTKQSQYEWKMLIALFGAMAGDLLLMFEHPLFFKIGLICYSCTHIGYALTIKGLINRLNLHNFLALAFIAIYFILIIFTVLPHTGIFYYYIMLYCIAHFLMIIIVAMQNKSNFLVFGSFYFVLSNLLLAGYKFKLMPVQSPIYIMLSYAIAQYLIVKFISHMKSSPNV